MLTLKRFKALTDSYGADPGRWPEAMRADAEALLRASAEARRVLADARALDEAIDASSSHEDALNWPPGDDEATLSRLRARVAARLADSPGHPAASRAPGSVRTAAGRATPAPGSVRAAAGRATPAPGPVRAAAGRATPAPGPVRSAAARHTAAPPWRRWLHVLPVAQWSTSARAAGMAAACGLIVAVGLLLGSMDVTSSTAQVDVLAMLQPSPLPFLADQ